MSNRRAVFVHEVPGDGSDLVGRVTPPGRYGARLVVFAAVVIGETASLYLDWAAQSEVEHALAYNLPEIAIDVAGEPVVNWILRGPR